MNVSIAAVLRTAPALATMAVPLAAQTIPDSTPALYEVDAEHSILEFNTRHWGVSRVRGRFDQWSATLTYDPGSPERSSVSVLIDVASLDTGNDVRDQMLRSRWFAVDSFPTIRFQSSAVRTTADGFEAAGVLTIRGVTRTVRIPFTDLGTWIDPPARQGRAYRAALTLTRDSFGVVYPPHPFERLQAISNEVTIEIEIQALRHAPHELAFRGRDGKVSIGEALHERLLAAGVERAVSEYAALRSASPGYYEDRQEIVKVAHRVARRGRTADTRALLQLYAERFGADSASDFDLGWLLLLADDGVSARPHLERAAAAGARRTAALELLRGLESPNARTGPPPAGR